MLGIPAMDRTADARPDPRVERALSGQALYGDDFSADEIERWFAAEKEGYYELSYGRQAGATVGNGTYAYAAVTAAHCFRHLPQRRFPQTLGIGSAHGAELLPVVACSDKVTVLEPSEGFATAEIAGKPLTYVRPRASGLMPFESGSFDLIVGFGVLHHIPNVSTVIGEMQRVLRPGGYALLREPTHSMGDWRRPRRGLTRHERGIPIHLFRSMIESSGLEIIRETRCMFSLTTRLQPLLRQPVWAVPWVVHLDHMICSLPIWPDRYHASHWWHKLRPTSVAFVLRKNADSLH